MGGRDDGGVRPRRGRIGIATGEARGEGKAARSLTRQSLTDILSPLEMEDQFVCNLRFRGFHPRLLELFPFGERERAHE